MRRTRFRLRRLVLLALTLSVTLGVSAVADAKKKKQKVGGTATISKTVNAAIPDGTASGPGVLNSTVDLGGKKFKKTRIRDVNVTFQTTGSSAASAADIVASLTSPNGSTTYLVFGGLAGASIGPLTIDDESPLLAVPGAGPTPFPFLGSPYVGTVQGAVAAGFGLAGCLCKMDDGPAPGTWTLRVIDFGAGDTSTLNSWKLVVQAGKAYRT